MTHKDWFLVLSLAAYCRAERGNMDIAIKRAYLDAVPTDGTRVLVDRLWPRGVTKARAQIDWWPKEITPSTELRKWYHQNPEQNWDEFQQRYRLELTQQEATLQELLQLAQQQKVTLITAAKDEQHNHVVVLKRVLEQSLTSLE